MTAHEPARALLADVGLYPTLVVAPGVELADDGEAVAAHRAEDDAIVGQLGMALETKRPQIPHVSIPSGSEGFRSVPESAAPISPANAMLSAVPFTALQPDFSVRLHERRLEMGLTFEGLAREAGVSSRAIRNWEKGDVTSPNPAFVARLCRPLACTLNWLLHGEGKEPEHGNDRGKDHQG